MNLNFEKVGERWATIQKSGLAIAAIACLLTLCLNAFWVPIAAGQIGSSGIVERLVELGYGQLRFRPSSTVFRRGNLEYAQVNFDGYDLFPVAVEAAVPGTQQTDINEDRLRAVVERVAYIENNLQEIVALDYLPFTLETTVGTLDGEVAIFAVDPQRFPERFVTLITQEDARLLGKEIERLAYERSEIVRTALVRARAERKVEYLLQQVRKTAAIVLGMFASSWCLNRVQRFLLLRMKYLLQYHPLPKWPKGPREDSDNDELSEIELPNYYPVLAVPRFEQSFRQRLNSFARELLRIAQVVIWLGGFVWILNLYPYSRDMALWLLNLPIRLFVFVIFAIAVKRGINFAIDNAIAVWVDRSIILGTASRRHTKRAPSLSIALKDLTQVTVILAVLIVILLEGLRLPAIPIVTAAGVIGFAARDLIKDCINGMVILWKDQFAIGDVVTIGSFTGYVELLSLNMTQLRSLDGELISIPNGAISAVQNLTSHWSRLNLGIDVAYDTDLDLAIAVIEDVAQSMRRDPDWADTILEPPLLLGVDSFEDSSIRIRLLMTTRPMQHWDVGREYRLRLKKAFDRAGIVIPLPQRSIWMETPRSERGSRQSFT